MRPLAVLVLLAAAVLSACDAPAESTGSPTSLPLGEGFDFYVLALSWSPGYCASEGERANKQQCGQGADFDFIVHGLWPQFERGWPEFCETGEPLSVPRDRAEAMADIMPSTGLVRHQWKKHGSCSGLSQADYFATTRAALAKIAIPDAFRDRTRIDRLEPEDVEQAFLNANPGMPAGSVAVTCDRRFLRDVRICLTRDLAGYAACPEVDRRDCPLPTVVVPPSQ
ncbi:MAG: ribonuclease [Roseitalea sp.]|uniref:Ribonuclease T n=1 Tax=Oceaniradius stylonematis TaxID=2184161 RepID=A0A3A8AKJ5_9HYPH|nr:ribonuclease T [Oceaniradius stylonematis]MBO6552946.1 ribonuclease [Roseitalea sp.]MBO6951294.1 ribonuclease [Rhizobiaceae bacterium]MBO6590719.1 ribonuclease [Roseitalea sp.]MBO6600023.1 ribonuclease [Roseitalea sp.]MBO6611779.1 ribonuclease [Roseitalea sp.]